MAKPRPEHTNAVLKLLEARRRHPSLSPTDLALVGYSILALDPTNGCGYSWLGSALAELGDEAGMREIFTRWAQQARTQPGQREAVEAYARAKNALAAAVTPGALSLEALRAEGWPLVWATVARATPRATGARRRCPRCGGHGDILEYEHVADGLCFLCHGRRTIGQYSDGFSPVAS